jgi:hypothetical protein
MCGTQFCIIGGRIRINAMLLSSALTLSVSRWLTARKTASAQISSALRDLRVFVVQNSENKTLKTKKPGLAMNKARPFLCHVPSRYAQRDERISRA